MKCSVENCRDQVSDQTPAKGMCRKHYRLTALYGKPESKYDLSRKTSHIDDVKDPRPGARGYLAVNLINDIKCKAKKRKKDWNLTHEQAFKLITAKCTYCGFEPKWPETRVGIDRVNSDIGYHIENCVPCCFTCNSAKNDLTLEEFKEWVKRIYTNLIK